MGSLRSHHDLMVRLSGAAHCRVLGVDYRLMPECRFPTPVEDCLSAYHWALRQGYPAHRLALAGDSGGGCLVAATLLAARERGLPLPASAVMLSALTDFEMRGASYQTHAMVDPIHTRALIELLARQYLGVDADRSHPWASPLNGDLSGLPPLLLQVGERETGLDDSRMFAERAAAAGTPVELQVWQGMFHVFQQFASELEEAREAIAGIGRFLDQHWRHS